MEPHQTNQCNCRCHKQGTGLCCTNCDDACKEYAIKIFNMRMDEIKHRSEDKSKDVYIIHEAELIMAPYIESINNRLTKIEQQLKDLNYTKPFKCPVCEGRGECPVCFGKVRWETEDGLVIRCGKCQGTPDCHSCKGKGIIWQ